MRINNNSYTDRLMRDDLIHRYSRTAQALNAEMPRRVDSFFADLADMLASRTTNTSRDDLLADTAQKYSQAGNQTERDTLLADTAEKYSRIRDTAGRYDPVLAVYSRNGELA